MTHRIFSAVLSAAAAATALTVPPLTAATGAQENPAVRRSTHTVRPVARGVEFVQEIIPDGSAEGPLVVNVLRIDPQEKGVRIEAALGQDRVWGTDPTQGREIVSTLAARRKAVGGINAGFFPFAGNPIGLHIQGGDIVTEPVQKRSVFYVTEKGKPGIAAFDYTGIARTEKDSCPPHTIHGMNRRPGKGNELLLFTPAFSPATLRAVGRVEVVLRGVAAPLRAGREYTGVITQIGEGGGTPLAKDTVVLSGGGTGADFVRGQNDIIGKKLTFRLEVTPISPRQPLSVESLREAVAGGPRLLSGGRIDIPLAAESMGRDFSVTRHPRTAVGITREGTILLVTIDGRQKGLSRGASLPETAAILLKHGAVEGVNMDGGGSTAMVVRDGIVNSPSDGRERAVANMLLVFAEDSKPGQAPENTSLSVPLRSLFVGETWNFVPSKTALKGIWGTKGGAGFVSQEGVFRAVRPGTAEVRLFVGGKKGTLSATVTVTNVPALTPPLPSQPVPLPSGQAVQEGH